jgi:hypothetical protein
MNKLTSHTIKVISLISIIVIVIVAAGIFSAHTLTASSDKLKDGIDKIEFNTQKNNWNEAIKELNSMKREWADMETLWSVLIDHIEIDSIDTSISRITVFIENKNKTQALTEVAVLKKYIKHIPSKEYLNFKNVF